MGRECRDGDPYNFHIDLSARLSNESKETQSGHSFL